MAKPKSQWYTPNIIELLRKNFLPGAKYMNEPKISRYIPSKRSACGKV